jgi:Family of unknown function (DUF6152)
VKNRITMNCVVIVGLLALCGPLFAHHGSGVSYDLKKQVTLAGTIVEMDWKNPHVFMLFDVKDDKGTIQHWGGETHTPAQLKAIGWNKDDLKVGDQITVTLFPSKVGASRGLIAKIVHNDKVIIDDGASRNRNPDE